MFVVLPHTGQGANYAAKTASENFRRINGV